MNGIAIVSMASSPILGTPDHIKLIDPEEEGKMKMAKLWDINKASTSRFVIDSTVNPHPRFLGLV